MKLNWTTKIAIGSRTLSALVLGRKVPLSVGWAVTKRCNARCTYCGKWNDPNDDTPHEEAVSLCEQFRAAGTRILSMTGGEPLVRDDVGELIRLLRAGGIRVILATNGILVPEKIDVVRQADRLNVSMDGPEDVHDRFRGAGSHGSAVEAVRAAQKAGVPVVLATVLHSANVDRVEEILADAAALDCKINVQPVSHNPEVTRMDESALPSAEQMNRAVRILIREKKRTGRRLIENSLPTLRHMLEWPKGRPLVCGSRKISCRVEPDGHVHNCGRCKNRLPETNYRERGFLPAFQSLPEMVCSTCWCSSRYEMNMLASMNPGLLASMLRRF